jgi:type IV secretion system protein VirB4
LSSQIGSFALLNNCPFGNLKSKWGEPVTILTTALGTPYFFHFHPDNKSNGHTIIIGDDEDARVMIRNFLFSEASKFNAPFIYIDSYKKSALFLKALNVQYCVFNFDANVNQLRLNPLLLEDKQTNRNFLRYWFLCLLNLYTNPSGYKEYVPVIDKAVDVIFKLPNDKRRLSNVAEFFTDKNSEITQSILLDLQPWHSKGSLAHIFDNDSDFMISNLGTSFAFDMTDIYDTSMRINLPVLMYILHFYREYFTGHAPSILCVSWSNRLFNSIYFEKNLNFILEDLAQRNAVCLCTASFCSKKVNWSETVGKIYNKHMATKIFLSNNAPSYPNLVKLFDLEPDEKMYLQSLSSENNQFLLKQGQNSTVMTLDLSARPKEQMILTGSEGYSSIVKGLIEKYGQDPKLWLPKLYEQIDREEDTSEE